MNIGDIEMFFRKIATVFTILILVLFSSCIKYYKLSKTEFPQGTDLDDRRKVSHNNLRTLTINDQFSTEAIFDFLWLSDKTRTAYVDMNCKKRGRDDQSRIALLRRQLEENKHWITFYVLADVRDKADGSLTDKNSFWSLYLATEEMIPQKRLTEKEKNKTKKKKIKTKEVKTREVNKVMPISIKEIDIESEYRFLFGPKFDFFSRAYEVKFPATDLSGKLYIKKEEGFKLVVSSPGKKSEVWFNKKEKEEEKGKILKNEDYYWFRS